MATRSRPVEDIEGRCNCLAARHATRYLTAAYDQALNPFGLRATQFSILYTLARYGPLGIGRSAEVIVMDGRVDASRPVYRLNAGARFGASEI